MENLLDKLKHKKEIKTEVKQDEKPETVDCKACGKKVNRAEAIKNLYVCPECGAYFRVNTKNRLKMVADTGSFTPWFDDVVGGNPLSFPGYEEKIIAMDVSKGMQPYSISSLPGGKYAVYHF